MSRTYSIVCVEAGLTLWIGQATTNRPNDLAVFYSDQPETMKRLGRFLQATIGMQLVILCDDEVDAIIDVELREFERAD